jgi:hypothetical protein
MKSFSSIYFAKDIKDILEADLVNFFAEERLESNLLEFKSFYEGEGFDKGLGKILEVVCAFLNSSGELLIWGAPSNSRREGTSEDIFIGQLKPVTVEKGQDWLVSKISDRISPMPKDISCNIVKVDGGAVYLIEVQESSYKPHQFDHQYTIRLDGQNRPAPHYIVQAMFKEVKYPDIRGIVCFRKASTFPKGSWLPIEIGFFNFSPFENEFDLNFRLIVIGATFYEWEQNLNAEVTYEMNGRGLRHRPFTVPLYYGMPHTRFYRLRVENGVDEVTILLSFGGRFSPAKTSAYKIDMTNLDLANPKNSLSLCEENELFVEKKAPDDVIASFKENNK